MSEWNFDNEVLTRAKELSIGDRVAVHWSEAECQDQEATVVGVDIGRYGRVSYTAHIDGDISPTDGFYIDHSGHDAGSIRPIGAVASTSSPPPAMTQPHELTDLAAKLSAVGIDAVDLDMIRRGDMLGPKLGAKVFAALEAGAVAVAKLTRERDRYLGMIESAEKLSSVLGIDVRGASVDVAVRFLKEKRATEAENTALRAKLERAVTEHDDLSRQIARKQDLMDAIISFVHRWTWEKPGGGTSDAERLDVIKHYPPIAARTTLAELEQP